MDSRLIDRYRHASMSEDYEKCKISKKSRCKLFQIRRLEFWLKKTIHLTNLSPPQQRDRKIKHNVYMFMCVCERERERERDRRVGREGKREREEEG